MDPDNNTKTGTRNRTFPEKQWQAAQRCSSLAARTLLTTDLPAQQFQNRIQSLLRSEVVLPLWKAEWCILPYQKYVCALKVTRYFAKLRPHIGLGGRLSAFESITIADNTMISVFVGKLGGGGVRVEGLVFLYYAASSQCLSMQVCWILILRGVRLPPPGRLSHVRKGSLQVLWYHLFFYLNPVFSFVTKRSLRAISKGDLCWWKGVENFLANCD